MVVTIVAPWRGGAKMNDIYSETHGVVAAECGTPILLTVQHVDIDPDKARILFEQGSEVGDWGWKHKTWFVKDEKEFADVQAAARFFYGWSVSSERVKVVEGGLVYEAWYAC